MSTLTERFSNVWNAFLGRDPTMDFKNIGASSYLRPDIRPVYGGGDRSMVDAIYNRIANDVAAVKIEHAKVNENGIYVETVKDALNEVLTLDANTDQTGRQLIINAVLALLDEGCIAIVPTDTTDNPNHTDSYDILSLRVGKIIEWYPEHVKVNLYNEKNGRKEDIILSKKTIAIIENPFYSTMNKPNSILRRLSRKLVLLDIVDEQSSASKLDLIIQLPYVIKSEARKQQAESRRKDIEMQLSSSKYGIAYTDGTERITQLNRPLTNNLLDQIEYLTKMLYNQLGLTEEIFKGTANEEAMINYYNRTIEPILSALTDEMNRKFLTKTARTQNHKIIYRRNPFNLVPVDKLADIIDKFSRNEVISSNEARAIIGFKPVDDQRADQLVNKNINTVQNEELGVSEDLNDDEESRAAYQEALDTLDRNDEELDQIESELNPEIKHYASPYYDPQKAHEYYEKHKQLKGRTSTSKLNEEGKIAASYINKQLKEERKSKSDEAREINKQQIKTNSTVLSNKISTLKTRLNGMSPRAKNSAKVRINAEIARLRNENNAERERLNEELKANLKSYGEDYTNKYEEAIKGLSSEKQYLNKKGLAELNSNAKSTSNIEEVKVRHLSDLREEAKNKKSN